MVFRGGEKLCRDAFSREDVANLKSIAQQFPGHRDRIRDDDEHSRAFGGQEAALRGREYVIGDLRTRAPVVVLTGIELFAEYSLGDTWNKVGGQHAHP